MKLPFRRDTASSLQKAIGKREAIDAKLADLQQKRQAALIATDDLEQVAIIDRQIKAERGRAGILADRIVVLDARVNEEAAAERVKAYETAVDSIARLLPLHDEAATEVEKALVALASALQKYIEVGESILRQWPTNIPRPTYQLSTLGERIRNCFSMPSLVYSTTHAAPAAAEYVHRACGAAERAAGFAEAQRTNSAELIDELRQRGAPPVPVIDDEVL